jgi:NarL family two-component system response regulator LiaR
MEKLEVKVARVLIVDDHEIFRAGLRISLDGIAEVEVVGESSDGQTAVHLCSSLKPDVVLMDVGMPVMDGVDATRQIKATMPEIKILMLTTYDSDASVFAALGAGADGYCMKSIKSQQLGSAITTILQGAAWLDPAIAQRVLIASTSPTKKAHATKLENGLSPRELEVLNLLVEGLTNQEMATRLVLSTETVKTHMRHIMEKLSVCDRTQAAVKAMKQGLVTQKEG